MVGYDQTYLKLNEVSAVVDMFENRTNQDWELLLCFKHPHDQQSRRRSAFNEGIHPTMLQVFMVSSVELRSWPSGQLSVMVSTVLRNCSGEMITPCAKVGAKRMELSIQPIALCPSEQFLLEISWPLSFQRNTSTGRPCCMHTF